MAFDLLTEQRSATVILNASVAAFAAAALATHWLDGASSQWAFTRKQWLGRWSAGSLVVALLANLAVLWLEAAAMAEVPVAQALGAVQAVLAGSHYGASWAAGTGALIAAGVWAALAPGRLRVLVVVPLCLFWYAQCMTSHASAEGDVNLFMLAYASHLGLASLWVGEVLVAAAVVLSSAAVLQQAARSERTAYVQALSGAATISLAGVFATGLYLAWRMVGTRADLFGTSYGQTLLAKLVLVGLAAAMGGFNRFFVIPALIASEQAAAAANAAAARFRRVLLLETLVLLAVLVLAAVLSSSAPPDAGM
jgi:putative copper resistance protein D